ncbi:MAG: CBS domain-containing protein [Polyangiaceae bacterium]
MSQLPPVTSSDRPPHDTLSDTRVSSVLRPPVVVTQDLPLSEVASMLNELANDAPDAFVVVVDEHEEPVGLLTALSVMRLSQQHSRESLFDLCAEDGVVQQCTTVPPNASVKWVAHMLTTTGEPAAIVVDPYGKTLGAVTARDLLRGLGYVD